MPLNDFAESYPALTSRLLQTRLHNRIAHGYLFVGESGSRMENFARAFMQLCVCSSLQPDGDACGTCRNCQGITNETYPFLNELRPQSKSRQIRVDDIRELEHYLHLTSGGETRLAVIFDADRMNEQTQNAFLKTLEEPAAQTIIILITCSPSMMLPTIRSRCQTIALLDNRVTYAIDDDPSIFKTLESLKPAVGSLIASRAAYDIQEHLAAIKETCKADGDTLLKELKSSAGDTDRTFIKQREEEIKGMQESLYRGERERFLSILHTWFSQEFMRASGVDDATLPHPEFYQTLPGHLDSRPSPKGARFGLRLVEKLLKTLNYNVDEQLAIEEFCHTLCGK